MFLIVVANGNVDGQKEQDRVPFMNFIASWRPP